MSHYEPERRSDDLASTKAEPGLTFAQGLPTSFHTNSWSQQAVQLQSSSRHATRTPEASEKVAKKLATFLSHMAVVHALNLSTDSRCRIGFGPTSVLLIWAFIWSGLYSLQNLEPIA
jgi:hypothetical protein